MREGGDMMSQAICCDRFGNIIEEKSYSDVVTDEFKQDPILKSLEEQELKLIFASTRPFHQDIKELLTVIERVKETYIETEYGKGRSNETKA